MGVGNEADIKFHEYLAFLRDDPKTKAIIIYVEGMRKGRDFLEGSVLGTTLGKRPISFFFKKREILQTGRKIPGGSHTGALGGDCPKLAQFGVLKEPGINFCGPIRGALFPGVEPF